MFSNGHRTKCTRLYTKNLMTDRLIVLFGQKMISLWLECALWCEEKIWARFFSFHQIMTAYNMRLLFFPRDKYTRGILHAGGVWLSTCDIQSIRWPMVVLKFHSYYPTTEVFWGVLPAGGCLQVVQNQTFSARVHAC